MDKSTELIKLELVKAKEENDRLSTQVRELKQVITAIRTQIASVKDL
jgi:hypothetical protein